MGGIDVNVGVCGTAGSRYLLMMEWGFSFGGCRAATKGDFLIYSGRLKTWRQPDRYGYYCVGVISEIDVNLWLK